MRGGGSLGGTDQRASDSTVIEQLRLEDNQETSAPVDIAPPWYEMPRKSAKLSPQVVLEELTGHPLSMRPIHPLVPGTGLAACGQPS